MDGFSSAALPALLFSADLFSLLIQSNPGAGFVVGNTDGIVRPGLAVEYVTVVLNANSLSLLASVKDSSS